MTPRRRMSYSSRPNRAARSAHARAARQYPTYDTSYIRPRQSRAPLVIAAIIVIALIVLLLFLFGAFRGCSSTPVAEGQEIEVVIPEGASTRQIGETLQSNAVISNSADFSDRVDSLGVASQLKPGRYLLIGGAPLDELIDILESGPTADRLVVPEGCTIDDIAKLVAETTRQSVTEEDFRKVAADASAFAEEYPFVADAYDNSLEGFLFPKTYELATDATAEDIVSMMLEQYKLETADLDYAYPNSVGLSDYDVLILASIIERESAEDYRDQVASVFYNRLAITMPLQSDATVAYLVKRDPTPEDLDIESPYNTYLNYGLPPGPICCPGLSCLEAACSPASTDYLYFYFQPNDDGEMEYSFSATYDEHLDAIG